MLVATTACRGVPTKGEASARSELAEVRGGFRPGEASPALPELNAQSSLDEFLRYAILRHPAVEAAYYQWAASIERITVARSLPDPVFTVGADVQKGLEDDVANMVMALIGGAMVELPGPGKLRARADLATEESHAQFASFQIAAIDTAIGTRDTYYELFLLAERISVTNKNLQFVKDIEESARRRSEAGLASLQDVLLAESDRATLENDLVNLTDQRTALLASWKSALGIGSGEPDPPLPDSFSFTDEKSMGESTLDEVLASNPRLRVMEADIKRAETALALAYKRRVPDFTLGLEVEAPTGEGSRNPRDMVWKPRVGVTVPIWRDRIAAEIAEAEAVRMAARADYSSAQLDLAREYALNAFGIREVTRNLSLVQQSLLPRQREILDLSQRGYQGGQTTFYELIAQQRRLLELELLEAEARAERERLIGRLYLSLLARSPLESASPAERRAKP